MPGFTDPAAGDTIGPVARDTGVAIRDASPVVRDANPAVRDAVTEWVRAAEAGLRPLLAEAQAVWNARADIDAGSDIRPGWRPFEDAFPTFYQFTNRPR